MRAAVPTSSPFLLISIRAPESPVVPEPGASVNWPGRLSWEPRFDSVPRHSPRPVTELIVSQKMSDPMPFAPVDDLGVGDALEDWRWLVGSKAQVRLVTAMGDLFVLKPVGFFGKQEVWLVDTYAGVQHLVAPDWATFKQRIASPDLEVSEWLKFDLLCEIQAAGSVLSRGECYSPTIPPVIGGKFECANFTATPWRAHIGASGQIHHQVKDLAPGTSINGIDVKWE